MAKKLLFILLSIYGSLVFGQAPNWDWAIKACEVEYIPAGKTDTDNLGNIYHCGNFSQPSLQLGPAILENTNPGNKKIFISKRSPSGELLWSKSNTTTSQQPNIDANLTAFVTDELGNVYITGYFRDYLTFDAITITNSNTDEVCMFIFKFDSNGTALWGKRAAGTGLNNNTSITTDVKLNQNGDVFVSGYYTGQFLNFGNGVTLSGSGDIVSYFIVKYSSTGTASWARQAVTGHVTADSYPLVAADDQYAYFTCTFGSPISFGSQQMTSDGSTDIFLAKYSIVNGALVALKKLSSPYYESVGNIVAKGGNIYMAGTFQSPLLFSSMNLSNPYSGDIFVAKLDTNGEVLWAIQAGGSGMSDCHSIDIDNSGNVYFSGLYITNDFHIQGNYLPGVSGEVNTFIAKINSSGTFGWSLKPEGVNAITNKVNALADGSVVASGYYKTDVTFGDTGLTGFSQASFKDFIAKVSTTSLSTPDTSDHSVTMYPNPVITILNIGNNAFLSKRYSIWDATGRVVKSGITDGSIDVSPLSSGFYTITVNNKNSKFIKE